MRLFYRLRGLKLADFITTSYKCFQHILNHKFHRDDSPIYSLNLNYHEIIIFNQACVSECVEYLCWNFRLHN